MKNINSSMHNNKTYICGNFEAETIENLIEEIAKSQVEKGEESYEAQSLVIINKSGTSKILTKGRFFNDFTTSLSIRINEIVSEMEDSGYRQNENGEWFYPYTEAQDYGVSQSMFI